MTEAALAGAYRQHWARLLALLTRRFGDLDLAEEALQEAFASAAQAWQVERPGNEAGWLLTAARRRALDRLRRRNALERRHRLAAAEAMPDDGGGGEPTASGDERLGLILMCCHPALSREAQVALTLRAVAGMPGEAIARLFLVAPATMAARLTRAKAKIRTAKIPFRVPPSEEIDERIGGALAAIYLIFTEGYAPRERDAVVRTQLCEEALGLARALREVAPASAETQALLALMLLQNARREARVDGEGVAIRLAEQDRGLWRHEEIAEAMALLDGMAGEGFAGPYHVQATIAAEHARVERPADWRVVAQLYALLEAVQPSPFVRLNRAVAVMEAFGARRGLEVLADVEAALDGYGPMHLARAEMLVRTGEAEAARAAFGRAMALSRKEGERRLIAARMAEVG